VSGEGNAFEAESEAILGETELPDWLSGPAPTEGGLSEGSLLDEPPAEEADELPDWLSSLGAPGEPGAGSSEWENGKQEEPAEEAGLPDWLQSAALGSAAHGSAAHGSAALGSAAVPPETPGEDFPLEAGFGEDESPSEELEPGETEAQAFPFEDEAGLLSDELSPEPEAESSVPAIDEPKWLRRIGAAEAVDLESQEASQTESPGERESGPVQDPWLAALPAAAAASAIRAEDSEVEAFSTEEPEFDLDWLRDETGGAETSGAGFSAPPFTEGFEEEAGSLEEVELPAWLVDPDQLEAGEEVLPAEEEGTVSASDLAAASLPGWLAALRPVEDAAPSPPAVQGAEVQIISGPLTGLKGILPAEPEVARAKRVPAYSMKLQVAEAQTSHAQLFTDLIEAEGAVQRLPGRAAVASSQTLRLLIFLILLGAVLWPLLIGSRSTPLPFYAEEVNGAGRAISALPVGAPVLLAVDFEPGFSGELETASSAVVDHLMRQGAYLALVSTTPTGPLQAERLLSGANLSGGYGYDGLDQYANLGFLPGGPGGLRSFAEAPEQMLPFALNSGGDRVWVDTPLQAVERLSDFALAVVLTENPDTARLWIEQAQPLLGDTPLVFVSSAQAGPLIRPYYEGDPGQVQGLVSGLAGGAAYERWTTRDGQARRVWDAYAFALPVAAVLIVLGTLLALLSNSMTGRRRTRRAAGSRR
jgi:hypothetical protein